MFTSHMMPIFLLRSARGLLKPWLLTVCFALSLAPNLYAEQYTCPMHPHYIASESGACPICGMDLVPMAEETASDTSASAEPSDTKKAITIAPEIIQNIGVRTAPAEAAYFGTHIRSFGLISENTRLRHVITGRVSGWVERLTITAEGDRVTEGQLLFTLYSPDLISAQQDYLAALSTGSRGRIRASAQRLVSMGVSQTVLTELRKTRKPLDKVPFYAGAKGIVSQLMIAQGSYIKPGSVIATLQGYDTVWVNASVAEKDLQFVNEDTKATITFPNLGNKELIAQVDYIYPTIEQSSRTGKVRLVLENPDGQLKPGAYADVVFETHAEKRLSVPSEAILRSAEGEYVVVAKGEGRFQSQRVKTGIQSQGRTEIVQGLQAAEPVVVSSQFMIDSESSLRESFRKLQRLQKPLAEIDVTQSQLAMIDHLIDAALFLHKSLVTGAKPKADLLTPALELNAQLLPTFRGTKLQFILEDSEKSLRNARAAMTDTERAQSLANLVDTLKPWILEGKPAHYAQTGVRLFLDHGTGFHWLQLGEKMQHPYGDGHAIEIKILENADQGNDKGTEKTVEKPSAANPQMREGGHAHH